LLNLNDLNPTDTSSLFESLEKILKTNSSQLLEAFVNSLSELYPMFGVTFLFKLMEVFMNTLTVNLVTFSLTESIENVTTLYIFSNIFLEARKELALALRQLSIRGDISTPVAYVSHLLESNDFVHNAVTTHWLDQLISEEVQIEKKPDSWLVVTCGALFKV
jgi:hypothetical protein